MAPDLLTYDEAAKALTVSASTVRRLVASGKIRGYAISRGCHRVDAGSLRAYLRQTKITGVAVCQSGKTAIRGAGASSGTGLSLLEAVALAKKRSKQKHAPSPS